MLGTLLSGTPLGNSFNLKKFFFLFRGQVLSVFFIRDFLISGIEGLPCIQIEVHPLPSNKFKS